VILYLAYGAFVVLKTVCLMCVLTYIAVIGIFVARRRHGSQTTLPSRLFRDLRTALASPADQPFHISPARVGHRLLPRGSDRPLIRADGDAGADAATGVVGRKTAERVVPASSRPDSWPAARA
jgi:hypothetical protein